MTKSLGIFKTPVSAHLHGTHKSTPDSPAPHVFQAGKHKLTADSAQEVSPQPLPGTYSLTPNSKVPDTLVCEPQPGTYNLTPNSKVPFTLQPQPGTYNLTPNSKVPATLVCEALPPDTEVPAPLGSAYSLQPGTPDTEVPAPLFCKPATHNVSEVPALHHEQRCVNSQNPEIPAHAPVVSQNATGQMKPPAIPSPASINPEMVPVTPIRSNIVVDHDSKVLTTIGDIRGLKMYTLYDVERQIGKGSFGTVYEAVSKVTGEHVAIKCILVKEDVPDFNVRRYEREAELLGLFQHENIVKLFHAWIEKTHIYSTPPKPAVAGQEITKGMFVPSEPGFRGRIITLVMELCDRSLLSYFSDHYRPLLMKKRLKWLKQILRALIYLHARNIIHRDLSPKNILLKGKDVKLADFGLAKEVASGTDTGCFGTKRYMAPELEYGYPASTKSDIFSLGMIALEMWSNSFAPADMQAQAMKLRTRTLSPDWDEQNGDLPSELLLRMVDVDPSKRPEASEVLSSL